MASKASIPKFAKLSPPRLPKVVERPRLYRQLDTLRKHHSLIWIAAPPGMGKTTLASSYLNVRKLKPVWFQADEGDRDPATLFHFLGLAHQQYAPRSRVRLPHFTLEYLKNLPFFSRTFFQQFYSRLKPQTVVVWDNFQELGWGDEIPDWFLDGWLQVPEDVTLMVLSREDTPSGLARVQANQQVGMVHTNELKLSATEVQALVKLQQVKSKPGTQLVVPELWLEKLQGWPAGLLLVIEQLKRGEVINGPKEKVFGYWSQEVLTQFSKPMQQALCQLSVLPSMTVPMAQELTGEEQVGKWLGELANRRYFTERRNDKEPVYQFHALFREFLHNQAQQQCTPQSWRACQTQAAHLLERQGEIHEAKDLFTKAGQQEEVFRLILTQAPQLAEQGRTELLLSWIEQLPGPLQSQSPWIILWRGICHFGINMISARSEFRQAFESFKILKDELGMVLAWAGLVDTIFWTWDGMAELEQLIADFEMQFPDRYVAPSLGVDFRITCSMLGAYMWKRLDHPDMTYWETRATTLLSEDRMDMQVVALGNVLAVYFHWTGQFTSQQSITDQVCRRISKSQMSPLSELMFQCILIHNAVIQVDGEKCLACSNRMEQSIKEIGGSSVAFPQVLGGKIIAHSMLGNVKVASLLLQEAEEDYQNAPSMHLGFYHHNKGQVALLGHHFDDARTWYKKALDNSYNNDVMYPLAINHLSLAFLEAECGQVFQAREHINRSLQVSRRIKARGLEGCTYLAIAFLSLQGADRPETIEALRHAIEFSRKIGFSAEHWMIPRFIARVSIEALQHGIEVEYVQSLIRSYRIRLENPPLGLLNWPWPMKIKALGNFELEVDGRPVEFGRKVPRRVLSLLQAIIAFGGENVKEDRLMDALWPEADGDRSYRSYATALHRLRKILGDEKAIIVKDSKVTLDPYLCWVDAWAFEHLCKFAKEANDERDLKKTQQLSEQARELYRAPFLEEAVESSWAEPYRQRLKTLLSQLPAEFEQQQERSA